MNNSNDRSSKRPVWRKPAWKWVVLVGGACTSFQDRYWFWVQGNVHTFTLYERVGVHWTPLWILNSHKIVNFSPPVTSMACVARDDVLLIFLIENFAIEYAFKILYELKVFWKQLIIKNHTYLEEIQYFFECICLWNEKLFYIKYIKF